MHTHATGGNEARNGEALYNHGGLAEIYCARIGHTYNKPKARLCLSLLVSVCL